MPLSRLALTLTSRRGRVRRRSDGGQIGVLILGLFVMCVALILGGIDVTAAQLARMRLLDTADAIALDASDAVDERAVYEGGLTETLVLTDASVQDAAASHLDRTPTPTGIEEWAVVPDTGSPDGATAVVTLEGRATLPMTGWFLESLGGGVTITVTSRARAPLQ